jgi:hypothetical protein
MLGEKLTELDTKQGNPLAQRLKKMFNMIPPEMHSDTRQPLCFNF